MSSSSNPIDDSMPHQIARYTSALKSFTTSSSTFRLLHSVPHVPSSSPLPSPRTLYILDSSFNPPTLAHLRIATSALLHDSRPSPSPKRLLLLLATQNADKAPQPAPFEHRLAMMEIFAHDLLKSLSSSSNASQTDNDCEQISVDIGVTTHPYFVDKAHSISTSSFYTPSAPQVHLVGFDTLVRILNPKYYPPKHTLSVLDPFFEHHRLRVTYRADDKWGAREEQDSYLREIGEGKRVEEGAKKEWVGEGKIELVEGRKQAEEVISSTRVREAVSSGDKKELQRLVTKGVADWVLSEKLYAQ